MVKCIIHAADIHIRNFSRMEEYSEQLEKFINECEKIASEYDDRSEVRIVIAGDIVNQKNTISNELIVFTSIFLRKLEEVAPVIIISGNHDMVVSNTSRTDTLTGIFETARFDNCQFLDMMAYYKSGCIMDDNITWALYSIHDDYIRPDIEGNISDHPENTVVGLYHGTIVGAVLNNGTVMDSGLDGDTFSGCDMVMAGHIHKRQVLKRGDVEIVYPGSLIQQSFGETVSEHGFAVWKMDENGKFNYEFVDIENDYGLYDMEVESLEALHEDKEKLINI
jgi:DNA repair exonuclease SbcCD nuclease subunit